MGPICNVITPEIKALAKEFGKNAAITNVIVSAWQTHYKTTEYPSLDQLRAFHRERVYTVDTGDIKLNENEFSKLSRDFSPFVLKDRIAAMTTNFMDVVSAGLEERIEEVSNEINTIMSSDNPDHQKLSELQNKRMLYDSPQARQIAIKDMTLRGIFDKMKENYQEIVNMSAEEAQEVYGERAEYIQNEYRKILDNFPLLLKLTCNNLENIEHVRIMVDDQLFVENGNVKKVLGGSIVNVTEDQNQEDEDFGDNDTDTSAKGNDGWSFKIRFVDPYSTLSKNTKEALSKIARIDFEGNIEYDDLGNIKYMSPEYTHTALLNIMSEIVTPDDFSENQNGEYTFPVLERNLDKYPWLQQIIDALYDNPSLIGSFYADLRKDFINYWTQYQDKDGTIKSKSLNENTAKESAYNEALNNYTERNRLNDFSIYDISGNVDKDNLEETSKTLSSIQKIIKTDFSEWNESDVQNVTTQTSLLLKSVGFDVSRGMLSNLIQSENGLTQVENTLNALSRLYTKAGKLKEGDHLIEQCNQEYENIAENIGVVKELDNVISFRDGDKTRYSYSTPNYVDTMIKELKQKDNTRRNQYLENEFGKYEWFKYEDKWKSGWLNEIANDENVRNQLQTIELISINGKEYEKWTPDDIYVAFARQYFSVPTNNKSQKQYAYYNMPIFSDSPIVKFVKFTKYTGNFKESLLPLFRDVVKQELWRIDLVRRRRLEGVPIIQNFDKNGDKFCFFSELNNVEGFLDKTLELQKRGVEGLDELNALIDKNITTILDGLFTAYKQEIPYEEMKQMLGEQGLLGQDTSNHNEEVNNLLEEYFWNQAYATTQIIELTTTDLAYYKNDIDFQKRYKEVYASGTKLNTNTKYGKATRRVMYLKDSTIVSNTFGQLKEVLDHCVSKGTLQARDRDVVLDKFKDINEADAQAYVSPNAMRSILDMMGAWTDEMEASLERFKNGEWDMADFNIIWQTIKPFVYTQIPKPTGLNDGKMMKVPHQNKNSEFLLLAAYQTIANSLNNSPKLRAIQDFMMENDIDCIQFESAVKAGGQSPININQVQPQDRKEYPLQRAVEYIKRKYEWNEAEPSTFKDFKQILDKKLDKGMPQNLYNTAMQMFEPTYAEVKRTLFNAMTLNGKTNPYVVHEIPYNSYVIQQPTPEHLMDTTAVYGSQLRNLIIADLPETFKLTLDGVVYTKSDVVKLYTSAIVENLLEDFEKLRHEFNNIYELQKTLTNLVKSSSNYSEDLLNALQIVKVYNPYTKMEEETFNIPFDNPSVTNKLQQLVTSLFKKRVTGQHIKGGNAILVSDYGLTHELQLVYNKDRTRLKGVQCYLPASSKEFFTPFLKTSEDGKYQYIDINEMPDNLKRMIGYRIPTEDKYSMAPLIIKGFLPQQNGSMIMLPADIVSMAGSDFDIDKMFLMIPEFFVQNYDMKKAKEEYEKLKIDDATNNLLSAIFADTEDIESILSEAPPTFKEWFKENKERFKLDKPRVGKVKYHLKDKEGNLKGMKSLNRAQRNNMLIDIIYGILTSEEVAPAILSSGNFDTLKLYDRITSVIDDSYMYNAFKEHFNLNTRQQVAEKIEELSSSKEGFDTIEDFIKKYRRPKNQMTVSTFVYNHKQNMTGGGLIGIYANNTVGHAKFQYSKLELKKIDTRKEDGTGMLIDYTFKMNGRTIKSLHNSVNPLGERISKNCAEYSAASVDNVKDPVLAGLFQNMNTAKIAAFMTRAGMSIKEITFMFKQPFIKREFLSSGKLEAKDLELEVKKLNKMLKNLGGVAITSINDYEFTTDELLDNILHETDIQQAYDTWLTTDSFKNWNREYVLASDKNPSEDEIFYHFLEENNLIGEYATLLSSHIAATKLMAHISSLADDLTEVTQLARCDSPNGAISNTLSGAFLQVTKIRNLESKVKKYDYPFTGVLEALRSDVVNIDDNEDALRDKLLKRDMPMLEAFYSLGIELPMSLISRYFPQMSPVFTKAIETVYNNAPAALFEPKSTKSLQTLTDAFFSGLVTYALSKTKIFGDSTTRIEDYSINTGYVNHSGGASGSDQFWGNIGLKYGVISNHYYHGKKTFLGNVAQTEEDFKEGIQQAIMASQAMGRAWSDSYSNLLARNWNQVKYSDTVYAIGHFVRKGEKNKKGYVVNSLQVDGGTGYAVQMAINNSKPVYVYDQERDQWYYHEPGKKWAKSDTPILTPNFAGIGTREINEKGKQAIEAVYKKTFGDSSSSSSEVPLTMEEKRDYYLNEFYKKFMSVKSSNKDISSLGIIQKLSPDGTYIKFNRSARLRQQAKDAFMKDFDTLIHMGEEGMQFAKDLFCYAYYKDNLNFGPNSFGNFFSTEFFNNFPEVVNTLRFLPEIMSEKDTSTGQTDIDKFLDMFYASHYRDCTNVIPNTDDVQDPQLQVDVLTKDLIGVPAVYMFNKHTFQGLYKYATYEGELYKLESINDSRDPSSKAVYKHIPGLESVIYNANVNIETLKQLELSQNELDENKDIEGSSENTAPKVRGISRKAESFDFWDSISDEELANMVSNSQSEQITPSQVESENPLEGFDTSEFAQLKKSFAELGYFDPRNDGDVSSYMSEASNKTYGENDPFGFCKK